MKQLILLVLLSLPFLLLAQDQVAFLDIAAPNKEKTVTTAAIEGTSIPFQTREGMILVEAQVNQIKGTFILDTGASSLVLNQTPSVAQLVGRGISQALETTPVTVEQFNWSNIQRTNVEAFQVDISHLEQVFGRPIAGIIGHDIVKEVELTLDYQAQKIQIRPSTVKGAKLGQPIAVIPFTMQAHLPIIKVRVGKKKLRLALDTASETNILDKKLWKRLNAKEALTNQRIGEVQGVDQEIKEVPFADIPMTQVQEVGFENMPYLFTDLSHLKSESGLYIDGLLGYPFFKQGKMSINYKERKIYVWSLNKE